MPMLFSPFRGSRRGPCGLSAKTRAAAQSVMEAAKQMLGESEGLKTYIDTFLNEVRAV